MSTIELDTKRMDIFRLLLEVNNWQVLQDVENVLYRENAQHREIPKAALQYAVAHSREDIKAGRLFTQTQMREKHPSV